jgi:hypothetical protein
VLQGVARERRALALFADSVSCLSCKAKPLPLSDEQARPSLAVDLIFSLAPRYCAASPTSSFSRAIAVDSVFMRESIINESCCSTSECSDGRALTISGNPAYGGPQRGTASNNS